MLKSGETFVVCQMIVSSEENLLISATQFQTGLSVNNSSMTQKSVFKTSLKSHQVNTVYLFLI